MSNIPEDIRKQIEDEGIKRFPHLASALSSDSENIMLFEDYASVGYALASSEIESLRKEVERLKEELAEFEKMIRDAWRKYS